MKDKFYEFCLDDYSTPGFVSSVKYYYGTLDDFSKLIENGSDRDDRVVDAYKELCLGNDKVEYTVAYSKQKLAERVEIIDRRTIENKHKEFIYINIYGCDYKTRYDKGSFELLLCKKKRKFIICYRATITNAQYESVAVPKKWELLGDMLWGYPGMILVENNLDGIILKNTLYMVLDEFTDFDEAKAAFSSVEELDLTMFYQDIFGDG